MNRLIILGNGFDLAHGLPTSYKHFIDNFWSNIKENFEKDEYKKLVSINKMYNGFLNYNGISNFNDFKINLREYCKEYHYKFNEDELICGTNTSINRESIFNFESAFFKLINNKNTENWVDVENEYYKVLKNYLKDIDNSKVTLLNQEFEVIKKLLEKYLQENVNSKFTLDDNWENNFINIFQSNSIKGPKIEKFYQEISKKEADIFQKEFRVVKRQIPIHERNDYIAEINFEHHFLSFNYTFTALQYIDMLGIEFENLNEIHGNLYNIKNPINFGFGDEMDKFYQEIEEKDDNEYLRNIKSFQYLHTQNYKRLLDLIDSQKFQVYIMGHSCGLSDRILLNTIFEHENCKSIKIFYHQKDDGTNNYTEITQNISRHFNKKKLMREKIVNKTLCKPLPQIKLIPNIKNGLLS